MAATFPFEELKLTWKESFEKTARSQRLAKTKKNQLQKACDSIIEGVINQLEKKVQESQSKEAQVKELNEKLPETVKALEDRLRKLVKEVEANREKIPTLVKEYTEAEYDGYKVIGDESQSSQVESSTSSELSKEEEKVFYSLKHNVKDVGNLLKEIPVALNDSVQKAEEILKSFASIDSDKAESLSEALRSIRKEKEENSKRKAGTPTKGKTSGRNTRQKLAGQIS
eukprot:TRINITY_DN5590_c0_g1_i1.p1 TRINITY_DN5590_c0_g1~~TRINITY_DN5590_c0_g1_i1.p1  ORF type:complete len:227 (-),score=118.65 TRINITY_DN5590_c0_g1_i1:61-741(-)